MPDWTKAVDKAKQYKGLIRLLVFLILGSIVLFTTIFEEITTIVEKIMAICKSVSRWVRHRGMEGLPEATVQGVSYERLREERLRRRLDVETGSQPQESTVTVEESTRKQTSFTLALHLRRATTAQQSSPVLPTTYPIMPYDV